MNERAYAHFRRVFGKSSDFKETFGTPEGQRTLGHILNKSGYFESSYVDGNAGGTAFNEGQRFVAMYILKMMKMDPEEAKRTATLAAEAERKASQDIYEE